MMVVAVVQHSSIEENLVVSIYLEENQAAGGGYCSSTIVDG